MEHKRRYGLFLAVLFLVCMLWGCHSVRESLRIATDAPEGITLHVLLPMTVSGQIPEDASQMQRYSEDGWYFASEWLAGSEESAHARGERICWEFMFAGEMTAGDLREYVREYPSIKIAAVDENGTILQVSGALSLIENNQFWKELSYDYAHNTITGTERAVLDDSMFLALLKWTAISLIVMIAALAAEDILMVSKKDWVVNRLCPIIWIVSAVPVACMVFCQYQNFFNERYVTDNWTEQNILWWMGVCDVPYIVCTLAWAVLWIRAKRRRKSDGSS